MYLLLAGGFFNELQLSQIATAIVAIFIAVGAILPALTIWLQLRLSRAITELRTTQQKNEVKIDALSTRRPHRSTDERPMESHNVPAVRGDDLAGHDPEPANSTE